jgi:signal transduction histidine kinase
MESAVRTYARLVSREEAVPFQNLEHELTEYWSVLEPVMRWDASERQARGYSFLSNEVFPRRKAMLSIADQIGAVNEQQLTAGNQQVGDLFSGFRVRLSVTLLVTLGLGAALAGFSVVRILRLERESSARFHEISQARSELKELSGRLVEAQENERRAISRELHDEVGQSLSALVVGLGNLAAAFRRGSMDDVGGQVESLRKLAESSVGVVRNMALLLRPSMLDDLGLIPALQWQAREVSKRTGMIVNVAADDDVDNVPEEYKTAIYRVVQEALHNCEQHAKANLVRVAVRRQQQFLLLSVQDDGRGFEPRIQKGMGLLGMQERIARLGGTFHIDSQAGHGTLILAKMPFASGGVQEEAGEAERTLESNKAAS